MAHTNPECLVCGHDTNTTDNLCNTCAKAITQICNLQARVEELEKDNNALAGQLVRSSDTREQLEAFSAQARKLFAATKEQINFGNREGRLSLIQRIDELLSSTPKLPDLEAADELAKCLLSPGMFLRHDEYFKLIAVKNIEVLLPLARRWLASRKGE